MLIEIRKVSRADKKDKMGNKVIDPNTNKPIQESSVNEVQLIGTEEIRNAVEWRKNEEQKVSIKGEITCLHMKSDTMVLINESLDSFASRSGAIRLNAEK
jgi:hypothetical protein